jgi:hypothetical protein
MLPPMLASPLMYKTKDTEIDSCMHASASLMGGLVGDWIEAMWWWVGG